MKVCSCFFRKLQFPANEQGKAKTASHNMTLLYSLEAVAALVLLILLLFAESRSETQNQLCVLDFQL